MARALTVAGILLLVLATPAPAQPLDGSAPMLCATQIIVECAPSGACQRLTPEEADLPPFVTIDVTRRLVEDPVNGRRAEIRDASRVDDRLVLQGADGGRGWSMIVEPSGVLSVAVVDEHVAFNVFGRCIAR